MNVNPWLPGLDLEDPLLDIVMSAELEGLGVLTPELKKGFEEGESTLEAMALAVAAVLTSKAIAKAWRRARAEAASQAEEFWLKEAARAGIVSRVRNARPPVKLLDDWSAGGIELHERLRDNVLVETRLNLEAAKAAGTESAVVALDLLDNGLPSTNGRMRGRGSVIASDQLFGLAALIAAFHQQDAGIKEFFWRTRGDSDVRESHQDLGGQRFLWDSPPAEGYPGEPVACRCWAEGVVE